MEQDVNCQALGSESDIFDENQLIYIAQHWTTRLIVHLQRNPLLFTHTNGNQRYPLMCSFQGISC